MAIIRRFDTFPTIEVLTEIESINIIDLAPAAPTTGVGSGTVMLVGEFEDGPFGNGGDSDYFAGPDGIQEVFGSEDYRRRFGGLGFTYDGVVSSNPCSRRHLSENWNGNGFLKAYAMKPRRLIINRVDTSVGEVSFSPLACIQSARQPFALPVGGTLDITSDVGGPASSTAVAATAATVAGAGFASPTGFAGGETIGIRIDGAPQVNVEFSAADQLVADVVAKVNATVGATVSAVNATEIDFNGLILGTDSEVELIEVTPGVLATIGHAAGVTNGTGNVGNVNAVTALEVAAIINGTAGLAAIDVSSTTTASGAVRVCSDTPSAGTISIAAGAMADALGLETGTTVAASDHPGGVIPAGTRVRTAGALEWVTMQTMTIPAEDTGAWTVKVRPALDDGTAVGSGAGSVVVAVDQPTFAEVTVNNPSALSAALSEVLMDNAYINCLNASLLDDDPVREINYSVSARRSPVVVSSARQNAIDASNAGLFGRKFITGDPIGTSVPDALANVALYRSDRVFYTHLGWKVRVPEIAARGAAGGLGFTEDGVITVRGDGPLATLSARLPPEENPGQETGLIEDFFEVDDYGNIVTTETYKAYRREGICAPRRDRVSGSIYQSGVTSVDPDVDPGKRTQARRKMADFIQDTLANRLAPFTKKLNKQSRRDGIRAVCEQFLSELKSESNPELARIADFSIDETSGNTPDLEARGIFVLIIRVRTLSSLDFIVLQTEIGEGVVVTNQL